MSEKIKYGNLRLPEEVIEEFKDWAASYRLTYGKDMSNGEVLRQMFSSVEAGDPAVYECYCEAMDRRERINAGGKGDGKEK